MLNGELEQDQIENTGRQPEPKASGGKKTRRKKIDYKNQLTEAKNRIAVAIGLLSHGNPEENSIVILAIKTLKGEVL